MTWHLDRLSPEAFWAYAARAGAVLGGVPDTHWQGAAARFAGTPVGAVAGALRAGDVAGVAGVWVNQAAARTTTAALDRLRADLLSRLDAQSEPSAALARVEAHLAVAAEIARFRALSSLPLPAAPPLPDGPA